MKNTPLLWTLLVVGALAIPNLAHADRRSFVWNYEAKTMTKGETELEYYLTASVDRPDGQDFDRLTFEHQAEVEYGITDNFDVAMYQIFRQRENADGSEAFTWRGYKARARYRFGEIGQYFVDPLVYLEFVHKPAGDEIEFEEKLVLSKNIGNVILALNGTFEQEMKYKSDTEVYVIEPSFGVGYQFAPWVTLGAETTYRYVTEDGEGFNALFAGPTISLAGESLWWSMGARFQITDEYSNAPRYEVRSLLGLFF